MVEQEKAFDSRRYWEERLQAHPDITGVGYLGYPHQFVRQYYRTRMLRVEAAMRRYGLTDLSGHSVLDIGSGTGFWLKFWHRHHAQSVAGLDFTSASVDILRAEFPGDLIVQADVRVAPLPLPAAMRFDVISAFEVLLHILDRDSLQRTIANLAQHCAPGGWLIISDPLVQGRGFVPAPSQAAYSTVHSVVEHREVLEANGFVIDAIRPATVLFCAPLEAPNYLAFRALSTLWKVTRHWGSSETLARLLGPAATQVDQLVCWLCSDGHAPGSKLIFARKLH